MRCEDTDFGPTQPRRQRQRLALRPMSRQPHLLRSHFCVVNREYRSRQFQSDLRALTPAPPPSKPRMYVGTTRSSRLDRGFRLAMMPSKAKTRQSNPAAAGGGRGGRQEMKRTEGCAQSKTEEASLQRRREAMRGRGGGARGTDNGKQEKGEGQGKQGQARCASGGVCGR